MLKSATSRIIFVSFVIVAQLFFVECSWWRDELLNNRSPWVKGDEQGRHCECIPDYQCDEITGIVIHDGRNIAENRQQIACEERGYTCCIVPISEELVDNGLEDNVSAEDNLSVEDKMPLEYNVSLEDKSEQNSPENELDDDILPTIQKKSLECGTNSPKYPMEKVFNDPEAAETYPAEFPWMLIVMIKQSQSQKKDYEFPVCGASLIGAQSALTAAHCVAQRPINTIVVRAGVYDLQEDIKQTEEADTVQSRTVSKVIIHSKYTRRPLSFDIALLIFDQPFVFDDAVSSVCLPQAPMDWENCVATGWGYNKPQEDATDSSLRKVDLPLISREKCQRLLRKFWYKQAKVHKSFLCAGGDGIGDTCLGDGGGPLTCTSKGKHYLVGITSWGTPQCGVVGHPGAYTNVTQFYRWIQEELQRI